MALRTLPRTLFGNAPIVDQGDIQNAAVGIAQLTPNLQGQRRSFAVPTIPTSAGTIEINLLAWCTGTITGVFFTAKDALATDNTNFVTFALVERGPTGVATTAVLATSPAGVNTSKTTGGVALAAYGKYAMSIVAGAVAANDVLSFQVTGAGTLANTLTEGCLAVTILPSS